jgi:uncharacterized protein DUF3800
MAGALAPTLEEGKSERLVAIWKVCSDESKDPGNEGWFVAAGVMATMGQWRSFKPRWRAALKADRRISSFHMSDSSPRRRKDPDSVFYGFTRKQVGRKIAALTRVLIDTTDVRITAQFRLEDFRHVMFRTGLDDDYRCDPYLLGFAQLFRLAAEYMNKMARPQKKPILVFDHWSDTQREARAQEIYDVIRSAGPGDGLAYTLAQWLPSQPLFRDDVKEDIGLQAADLVAWHVRYNLKRAMRGPLLRSRILGRRIVTHKALGRREIELWRTFLRFHVMEKRGTLPRPVWS